MATSLTAQFWERFTLLLFAAMGVTVLLTALFDALALRRANRRAHQPPVPPARTPYRRETARYRTSVRC